MDAVEMNVADAIAALDIARRGSYGSAAVAAVGFATLALVEETRTANLIAYTSWRNAEGYGVEQGVIDDIRTRLGLNQPADVTP